MQLLDTFMYVDGGAGKHVLWHVKVTEQLLHDKHALVRAHVQRWSQHMHDYGDSLITKKGKLKKYIL